MKTGFLITARLKSTRLPKKLLLEVNGESFITWMIRRLKLSTELDEIVICTSTNPEDDPLEEIAHKEGVRCFRGSEEDVVDRLLGAIEEFELDYAINMTADCPLVPFDLIPDLLKTYSDTNADLVKCHHLPVGIYLSGLKPDALRKLVELKASNQTEYWLYYFLKTDLFEVVELPTSDKLLREGYRIALDYPEDFEMFKRLYEGLGPEAFASSTQQILEWLDEHPEVVEINRGCDEKGVQRTKEDPTSKVKLKDGRVIE